MKELKGNKGFVQVLIMTFIPEVSYRAKGIRGSVRISELSCIFPCQRIFTSVLHIFNTWHTSESLDTWIELQFGTLIFSLANMYVV